MKISRNNTKYYRNYNNLTFENILIKIRRNLLISQLKKYKPKRILEIGCGNASIAYYYKNFSNFTIIEPTKYFINKNVKLFKKNKKVTLINSYLETAHDLINKKKIFDFVICSSVLHEVSSEKNFMMSLQKYCNKKTIVHINVPNSNSFHRLIAYESSMIKSITQRSLTQKKMQQFRIYNLEKLTAMIKKYHFKVISKGSFFFKPFTHKQMYNIFKKKILPEKVLIGLSKVIKYIPNFGAEIYINVKKR